MNFIQPVDCDDELSVEEILERSIHLTDIDGFYEIIQMRRDVRNEFIGGPMDQSKLKRILRAAHQAPSVGMTQPWDFILVDDDAIRSDFRDHVLVERSKFSDRLIGEAQETFNPIKIEGIMESAIGIVVTYDPSRGGSAILGRNTIDETGLYSVCLAIENLWLAATAEGYGVGWVSFYQESFLCDLVGIPSPLRPIAWLCLGPISTLMEVPDLERFNWRGRRPLEEALFQNRYGERLKLDL